jgi:ribosomal protein S18 acetylase RimI-like enzyme
LPSNAADVGGGVSLASASSTVDVVKVATAGARARLGAWPHEPDVGHLVLVDHEMVPTPHDVAGWLAAARESDLGGIRTGALFPRAAQAFVEAGFSEIDSLLLLESDLHSGVRPVARPGRTRRLNASSIPDAARVDERAFGRRWSNDAASLGEIRAATPHHRSRMIVVRGELRAFAISGRAGTRGYLQRVAVDPGARRQGFGRVLVADALGWMRRHRVTTALVNTATDNVAARALYDSFGFRRRDAELKVLEFTFRR